MNTGNVKQEQGIFVFGETLFTEGIAKTLSSQAGFKLVGQSSAIEVTEEIIQKAHANLIIVDATDQNKKAYISTLIFQYPSLSFVFANLANYCVQVVSSYLVHPDATAIKNAVELIRFINSQQRVKG